MKGIIKDSLILFVITLILGFCLAFVNEVTKDKIVEANREALYEGYGKVLGEFKDINDITEKAKLVNNTTSATLDYCGEALDEDGSLVGYAILTHAKGYGGDIKVLVGFDSEINIVGLTYPESLSETPGIGMKVQNQDFIDRFISSTLENMKDVETISGATRSSTAVKQSVLLACDIAKAIKNIN